jgi:hypothetical protein
MQRFADKIHHPWMISGTLFFFSFFSSYSLSFFLLLPLNIQHQSQSDEAPSQANHLHTNLPNFTPSKMPQAVEH